MATVTYKKLASHLEKTKAIYETLQLSKKEIKEVEQAIEIFIGYGDVEIVSPKFQAANAKKTSSKNRKVSFSESVDLLFQKRYKELVGTKISFEDLHTSEQIQTYIDTTTRSKIMKETTVMDLKLLYCLLTGEKVDIKGTKNEVYEVLKSHIRARKRGKAFSELI
ncbi:hypothetical protein [Fredinandcohnia sp. 179-A 10B2 NHS]|uniref:hypothetical protein n=1 Tax=Fredinandcohnia sp. 179-A 10B2 NHS TaxID=3235176 RepID=UPI0039A30F45